MTTEEKKVLKEKAALAVLTGLAASKKGSRDIIRDSDKAKSYLAIAATTMADAFVRQMEAEEE